MFCCSCGSRVDGSAGRCSNCGNFLPVPVAPQKRSRSRWGVAALIGMAIFLAIGFAAALLDSAPSTPRQQAAFSRQQASSPLVLVEYDWKRTDYGSLFIVGTVRNMSANPVPSAEVRFNLYDKTGAIVGNASDYVQDVAPFGTWRFKALVPDDERVHSANLQELRAW